MTEKLRVQHAKEFGEDGHLTGRTACGSRIGLIATYDWPVTCEECCVALGIKIGEESA